MRYLIFDTETSGLDAIENTILSLSYQIVDSQDWHVIKERDFYFPWPTNERRVSPTAISVNGLTKEYLASKTLSDRRTALTEFIKDVVEADLIVAHNLDLDKRMVKGACMEFGVEFCGDHWANTYDTMREMTEYCQLRGEYGSTNKWPKLKELAQVFEIDCSDIDFHKSSSDVEVTKRCFIEIVKRGLFIDDCQQSTITAKLVVNSIDDIKILYYQYGRIVSEEFIPAAQKREVKKQLYSAWAKDNEEETEDIVRCYRYAPSITSLVEFNQELASIEKVAYQRRICTLLPPSEDEIIDTLYQEAKEKYHSLLFWKNKAMRTQYVASNLEVRYEAAMRDYQIKLSEFENEEDERERVFNEQALSNYKQKYDYILRKINGDKDLLIEELRQLPKRLSRPLQIQVDPEINQDSSCVSLSILLPQIDEIPQLTAGKTSSGNIRIQSVPKKMLQDNYAECIAGLGFYFIAQAFNISPSILNINVRGYLPMFDTMGQPIEQDVYAYTITREQAAKIDFKYMNPIEALKSIADTYNMPKNLVPKVKEKVDTSEEIQEPSLVDLNRLDPILANVARYVVGQRVFSVAELQRHFEIGYNRVGKLMDQLEAIGVVGPQRGSLGREVLIDNIDDLETLLNQLSC